MADKQIAIYEKKVNPLAEQAKNLKIKTPEDMKVANDLLSSLKKTLKSIEAEEDKVLEPLKLAVKNEKARWKPFKDAIEPEIDSLRSKMSVYQTKEDEKAEAKKEKIEEKVKSGDISFDKGMDKMDAVKGPEARVEGENGSTSFREDKKFEVMDMTMLPIEFHLANEVAIRAAMKEGTELPGVRYFVVKTPITRG